MTEKREHWGSKIGFILTAAGSAIGLGTMWKLPYVVGQNGGGAFLLLFLLFNLIIGVPLFITELMLGREAQRGAVGTFAKFTSPDSSWNLLGWLSVITSFMVLSWYCVVAGWGMNYIVMTLTDVFANKEVAQVASLFTTLQNAGDLNIVWQIAFIAINSLIVLRGLSDGIEKWSTMMTTGLIVALLGLVGYSMTLSGFGEALHYVLYPDFSELTATGVLEALSLALFTLSLAYGVMVTYGSYMKKGDDIPQTSLIVGSANFIVSTMIAIMIFPMVFTLGLVPTQGEGLIFQTLPYVFAQLPGGIILSLLFFILLIFAAITSSVSMFEVTIANFSDLYKWSRPKATKISCLIVFILGLPVALQSSDLIFPSWNTIFGHSYLETINIVITWFMVFVALGTSIFAGWVIPESSRQAGFGSKTSSLKTFYPAWKFLIRYILPLAIILMILNNTHVVSFEKIIGLFW